MESKALTIKKNKLLTQNIPKKIWIVLGFCLILTLICLIKIIFNLVMMNKFQKETYKGRLLKLAALKSTGAPAELAFRFEISERSVKRMVREIREEGTDIWYCQIRRSYVLE